MTSHTTSHNGQVRLRDVAERAGVSAGTVSNTLNHPDRVHARTQALVKEAIEALGYVPNQQARMLTGAASKVMGLVVLDVESPFYMETAQAIERSFRESGHFLMLCNSESDLDREAELLRMLAAQRVRGVLLAPATADADPHQYLDIARDLPVVLLDFDGGDTHCSVAVDNVDGGRLAARHLLRAGHRKLAFIGGPAQIRQFTERAAGARAELIDAGLDPEVHLVEIAASGIGIQDGHAAAEELLAVDPPEGVLCGNDMLAFGAYRAMTAAGLRIPQDVSIVGYDDINVAKDWIVPMTTVRQPIDELGRIAARLILEDSSDDAGHVHRHVRLRPELVIRRSTAAR
ncbi:LacI family DNA-binding transcriptional regulator [Bogoriella caseilytica]|uniref:LacI family transcriptional regulator n=1 Tax=Bogoriella caseilytica TaxID=56055 RepID=A0A3N2BB04_9MICO|nr:LacI family DNA-binding transcriptional regulator [Bogoriella caseilytica]ROR72443.1 LacI family transcriptional regulator [Bogoriella caseilytica]